MVKYFFKLLLCSIPLVPMPLTRAIADVIGVTDSAVTIGAHTNESGVFAIYGAYPRIISAYFDRVNANGGVNGRKINFIRIDVQGDILKTVQATRKLVEEDHIFAMVFGMGSSHEPAYKYLVEKGVPDLYTTDGILEYGFPLKKGVVAGNFPYVNEGHLIGEEIVSHFRGKRACFLLVDTVVGEEYLKGATEAIEEGNKKLAEAEKVKIAVVERVERTALQANTQILNFKKGNCDVVFNTTYSGLAPNSMTYAFTQGFRPTWMVMHWNVSPKFFELLPAELRDGIVSSTTVAVSDAFATPGYKDYKELALSKDLPLSRTTANGYAMAELFVENLKRAGKNLDRQTIIDAAESMNGWKCSVCLVPVATSKTFHYAFEKPLLLLSKGGQWTAK